MHIEYKKYRNICSWHLFKKAKRKIIKSFSKELQSLKLSKIHIAGNQKLSFYK